MNAILMNALLKGLADIIAALTRTLAKSGLAIILLFCGILSIGYFSFFQYGQFREAIKESKAECDAKIIALSGRLDTCEAERMRQAIEIAVLKVEIKAFTSVRAKQ